MKVYRILLSVVCMGSIAWMSGCDQTILSTKRSTPLITDQQDFTRQIDVPPNIKILEIHHTGGNLSVVGWEKPFILVEGVIRASAETVEIAQSILDMVEIVAYEKPMNRLVLDYEGPAGFARKNVPEEGMDYTANVPRDLVLDVQTSNGSVRVSNMQNDTRIQHAKGDIRVEEIAGNTTIHGEGIKNSGQTLVVNHVERNADIESKYLDVAIQDIGGEITIQHQSGDLRALDIHGKLTLTGRDAPAFLGRIQGLIQIDNQGGDVICDGFYDGIRADVRKGMLKLEPRNPVKRSYECKVNRGNLILRVPENSSMLLDLMAENGSINSEFYLPVSAEGKYSFAKGAIGEGFPSIRLQVIRGGISVIKEIPLPDKTSMDHSLSGVEQVPPDTDLESSPVGNQ